jgi:hypothetical protein
MQYASSFLHRAGCDLGQRREQIFENAALTALDLDGHRHSRRKRNRFAVDLNVGLNWLDDDGIDEVLDALGVADGNRRLQISGRLSLSWRASCLGIASTATRMTLPKPYR